MYSSHRIRFYSYGACRISNFTTQQLFILSWHLGYIQGGSDGAGWWDGGRLDRVRRRRDRRREEDGEEKPNYYIWTSIFIYFFTIFSQFINFVLRSNVAWFNMIYNIHSKVAFLQFYALKFDLSCLKILKKFQLGDGAQPPPQTPPHTERKNQYCGRTTFQHLAPPLVQPRKINIKKISMKLATSNWYRGNIIVAGWSEPEASAIIIVFR